MSQISLSWQQRLVAVEFIWHHSISSTPKNPCWAQRSRYIVGPLYKPTYSRFWPKFRCYGNGGWQRGLVAVQFVWCNSIARPRKFPAIRKELRDISYIGRVIADFVPNFVVMATGVGRSRICLASFNSLTPKTPCWTQRSPRYLVYRLL